MNFLKFQNRILICPNLFLSISDKKFLKCNIALHFILNVFFFFRRVGHHYGHQLLVSCNMLMPPTATEDIQGLLAATLNPQTAMLPDQWQYVCPWKHLYISQSCPF